MEAEIGVINMKKKHNQWSCLLWLNGVPKDTLQLGRKDAWLTDACGDQKWREIMMEMQKRESSFERLMAENQICEHLTKANFGNCAKAAVVNHVKWSVE